MRASIFYNLYAIFAVLVECVVLPNSQTSLADEAHVAPDVASLMLPDVALASSAFIANGLIATSRVSEREGDSDSAFVGIAEPIHCKLLAELPADQQQAAVVLTDLPEVERFCALDEELDCSNFTKSFEAIGVLKDSNGDRYCTLIPALDR